MKKDRCACGQEKQARCKTCNTCRVAKYLKQGQTFRTQAELVTRIVDAAKRLSVEEINEYMKQVRRDTYRTISIAMMNGDVDLAFIKGFVAMYADLTADDWSEQESDTTINRVAHECIIFLERAYRRQDVKRFASIAAQFRAWKWMLGHPDADTLFDTSQGQLLERLRHQLKTGVWDRFNFTAKGRENETRQTSTAPASA